MALRRLSANLILTKVSPISNLIYLELRVPLARALDLGQITKALEIECLGETKLIASGMKSSIIPCHSPLEKIILFFELYSSSDKRHSDELIVSK